MVYIASDGTVCQSPPWGWDRLVKLFYGAINFVVFFFQTLVGLDATSSLKNVRSGGSAFKGGSGGGGGGSGGSGGRGPFGPGGGGGGPSKRIMTMRDVNPPTIGGCPGGACGR